MFQRVRHVFVTILLGSVAGCAPPVQMDFQPANAAVALQPAAIRMVTESDYMGGRAPAASFSSVARAIMPARLTGAPRTSFYTEDGIVAIADITWTEATAYGGVHNVDWRLFRNNEMLKDKRSEERFASKPARILSHISANSFPPGDYRLDLLLDQKPFSTLSFSILATQAPAPLAVAINGPDCAGAPQSKIKPIHRQWPIFPSGAVDRHESGCASVSIILDSGGYPSGVRVDGEYPANAGFGTAVTQAALGTVFPSGHGGETTYMVGHFKVSN